MKRLAGIAVAAALLGCQAALVEVRAPGAAPRAGARAADPGGGEVKYSLGGWQSSVETRRRDALAKMAAVCGGPDRFRVLEEADRETQEAQLGPGDLEDDLKGAGRHYARALYRHVVFECAPSRPGARP